ncbi:MAG: M23 family metallopeptidase [Candidatus Aureabacteria bacterium]|nr:M23 family metallopeptidase [Candidatus Auribacterota bacterium]
MKILLKKIVILTAVSFYLFLTKSVSAENAIPVFSYPLEKITHETGSFGEFRKDHFHAGIDISTNGKTGWKVISPVDGYISRIKVSSFGYGKALYIKTHDGSYVIVFAHLESFTPEIDKEIRKKQLATGKYFHDIYFKETRYKVSKGEIVAYSGDSGGVFPHLHFEVRNSFDHPIRFSIKELRNIDRKPPVLKAVAIQPMEADAVINGRHEPAYFALYKKKNGEYTLKGQEINAKGKIGISLYAFDESGGNKLGLNHVEVISDREPFSVNINRFSYGEYKKLFFAYSRNAYLKTRQGYLNLFNKNIKRLTFYQGEGNGIFNVTNASLPIKINAYDESGNRSCAKITLNPYKKKVLDYSNDIIIRDDRIMFFSDKPGEAIIIIDGTPITSKLKKIEDKFYTFTFDPRDILSFRRLDCRIVSNKDIVVSKKVLSVMLEKDRAIKTISDRFLIETSPETVLEKGLIYIIEKKDVVTENPELTVLDKTAFDLEPRAQAFWDPITVGVKLDNKKAKENTALFMKLFDKWEFISNRIEKGFRTASLMTGGLMAVFKDNMVPSITLLNPKKEGLKNKLEMITLEIKDDGSGIDYDSLQVRVNGEKIPFEVNTRFDLVMFNTENIDISENKANIYVSVLDNTGNKNEKDFSLFIR